MKPPKLSIPELSPLFPDFQGIHEIGSGGYKTVYKGTKNGRPEVIKVVSIPAPDDPTDKLEVRFQDECVARVRREVAVLQKCQSAYLVKLASSPLSDHVLNGFTYSIYSEEFLDGPDLWKLIRGNTTRPSENESKQLMRCLLESVRELWSMRYVHRDIKPANVIKLNDPNRPFVLIDLGLAFGVLETNLTGQGVPCTTRYLAPEMANPHFRVNLDYRTDLYTTALTVYEYAAGKHPIARDSDDPIHTVSRALHQPPKPLKIERPDFSLDFCEIIDQLLKKKPALRPANFDILIAKTEI